MKILNGHLFRICSTVCICSGWKICTCNWNDCKLQLYSVTTSVICLSLSFIHPFFLHYTYSLSLVSACSPQSAVSLFQSQYFPSHLLWLLAGREKVQLITTATSVLHKKEHTPKLISIFLTHVKSLKQSFSLLFSFRKQPPHSAFICPVPLSRHTASFPLCRSLISLLRLHLHY